MNEKDILLFMLESINEDNYNMSKQAGMSEEEIRDAHNKSQPSLSYMVLNLYNKMKDSGLVNPTLQYN